MVLGRCIGIQIQIFCSFRKSFFGEKRGFPAFQTRNRRLKPDIEAFVTNVFFVILDSKNSTVEHKLRVVVSLWRYVAILLRWQKSF